MHAKDPMPARSMPRIVFNNLMPLEARMSGYNGIYSIMVYYRTPYVGMTLKKMAATLIEVHNQDSRITAEVITNNLMLI